HLTKIIRGKESKTFFTTEARSTRRKSKHCGGRNQTVSLVFVPFFPFGSFVFNPVFLRVLRASVVKPMFYSHSIVPGGLEVMSYTTRLMPRTSFTIRLEIRFNTSYGSGVQSAVMPSSEC